MRRMNIVMMLPVLVITATIALAQWGSPGAVVEENEYGAVNYSERMVYATGIGTIPDNATNPGFARANAIRAAKMDAVRNLVESVKAVRLTSETTVSNSMIESDVIRTQVEAMVQGAEQVGEVKYLSDTSVEVTMRVPASGIMDLVLPATPVATAVTPPTAETPAEPAPAAPAVEVAVPGQPITGLIIDTRGLEIKPSMSPQVLSQDGNILYGPGKYPREFAVQHGVVGYHKNPESAKDDPRVRGNPVTIKGIRKAGTMATDIVISSNDAARVAALSGFSDAVGQCRVMFILD